MSEPAAPHIAYMQQLNGRSSGSGTASRDDFVISIGLTLSIEDEIRGGQPGNGRPKVTEYGGLPVSQT